MRPFYWKIKKIPVYGNRRTINALRQKYTFVLKQKTLLSTHYEIKNCER